MNKPDSSLLSSEDIQHCHPLACSSGTRDTTDNHQSSLRVRHGCLSLFASVNGSRVDKSGCRRNSRNKKNAPSRHGRLDQFRVIKTCFKELLRSAFSPLWPHLEPSGGPHKSAGECCTSRTITAGLVLLQDSFFFTVAVSLTRKHVVENHLRDAMNCCALLASC